jgi:hypothetical protein
MLIQAMLLEAPNIEEQQRIILEKQNTIQLLYIMISTIQAILTMEWKIAEPLIEAKKPEQLKAQERPEVLLLNRFTLIQINLNTFCLLKPPLLPQQRLINNFLCPDLEL